MTERVLIFAVQVFHLASNDPVREIAVSGFNAWDAYLRALDAINVEGGEFVDEAHIAEQIHG